MKKNDAWTEAATTIFELMRRLHVDHGLGPHEGLSLAFKSMLVVMQQTSSIDSDTVLAATLPHLEKSCRVDFGVDFVQMGEQPAAQQMQMSPDLVKDLKAVFGDKLIIANTAEEFDAQIEKVLGGHKTQ